MAKVVVKVVSDAGLFVVGTGIVSAVASALYSVIQLAA